MPVKIWQGCEIGIVKGGYSAARAIPQGEAISIETFAFSLGLRPAELITFVRRNKVSCQQMAGARGSTQLRMSAADRQAFHDRFISFRALGIAAGLGWHVLQARPDASGIGPAGGSARI